MYTLLDKNRHNYNTGTEIHKINEEIIYNGKVKAVAGYVNELSVWQGVHKNKRTLDHVKEMLKNMWPLKIKFQHFSWKISWIRLWIPPQPHIYTQKTNCCMTPQGSTTFPIYHESVPPCMEICVVQPEVMETHKILSQLFSEKVSNASVTFLDNICACVCNTSLIIILQSCETRQPQKFSH